MLHELLTRFRFLFRPKPRSEVEDELRFHLEHQVEANIAAGMSPDEARRQAVIAFGSVERAREECREQRPGYWAETFLQDVRYALRGFRRNPTFTLTIVLTLMLGIGATTAVFSVIDRILFRSLPYGHADRLVSVGLMRLTAWVLFGVVMAVLLIACANVTSLLMARGAGRERELAVRSALGAARARLVRQALTESLVLSVAGAVAGCAFAELMLRIFIAVAPEGIQHLGSVPLQKTTLDLRIILFTLITSLLCGAISGLAPALRRPRAEALTGRTAIVSHAALRQALVVVQIAASMVLLAAGALLFRSFLNLQSQRLGMRTESVVTATISLGENTYPTSERQLAFFQQLQAGLKYGPGATTLAISDSLPPGGYHRDQIYSAIVVEGRPKPTGGTGGMVAWRWVTPDYFKVLDIPILEGRGFTQEELDSSERFVVLSKSLSARLFPGQDPIGQHLRLSYGGANDPPYTVVAVAADVKNAGLADADEPEYYRLRRNTAADWDRASSIIIKTNLPADTMKKWIRAQVAAIDPTVPVETETLSERVSKMADQPRFEMLLVSFFAATGLLLTVVGLYGVISFLVGQRTQEIGLRMALGATRTDILQLVVRSGLRLILGGTFVGLIAALALSRFLSSLLFSIGPHDPIAFASVTVLLVLVGLLATLIPATSASGVNPTVALRSE